MIRYLEHASHIQFERRFLSGVLLLTRGSLVTHEFVFIGYGVSSIRALELNRNIVTIFQSSHSIL